MCGKVFVEISLLWAGRAGTEQVWSMFSTAHKIKLRALLSVVFARTSYCCLGRGFIADVLTKLVPNFYKFYEHVRLGNSDCCPV